MIFLLLTALAFADCKNLIDRTDAEKMVAGIPHGKTILKCESKDCVCIDGVRFEVSKLNDDGTFSVDREKQTAYEQAKLDRSAALKAREDAVKVTHPEVYDLLKEKGIVQ